MYQVATTSNLVLLFSEKSIYKSSSANKFFENLDLSNSRAFAEDFLKISDGLELHEQMHNRKYGIKKISFEFLSQHPNSQVIILGGGLDPFSLELAEMHPQATILMSIWTILTLKKILLTP